MNDGQGFQKRRHLLDMLDDGLVMVHVDPRGADVIVPQRFKSDPVLRLNLAYMFRLPALDIGAEGIYAVLSFDKQNFGCTLPWSCVFAVTRPDANHEGIVWPESAPAELRGSFARAGVSSGATPLQSATRVAPLAAVPADASDASDEAPAEATPNADNPDAGEPTAAEQSPPRRRGHLALVKG